MMKIRTNRYGGQLSSASEFLDFYSSLRFDRQKVVTSYFRESKISTLA